MTSRAWLGLVVAGVLLGFAFGQYSTPERVVERTRIVHSERSAESTGIRTSDDERVSTTFVRILETRPDGTRIETERHEAAKEIVREVDVVRTVEVERVVIQEKERLTESSKPAWRVALDLGVADAPHRVEIPGVPRYLPIVATAAVDRRIAGPVFVGAWVSSSTAGGLRLSVEF